MTIRMPLVPAVVLLTLACTIPALAQSEGRLTGVVRDATGAGMSGVTVTATNQATNQPRTTTTGADGSYALSLPPGTYAVSIALPDFRKVSQTVQIASPPASLKPLDFTLEAQLSEEITVTATKREQTLLEVPFSVAAPTEELLRTRGVENIEGIAANVSGLTVQNLGPGQSQVAMRGVSAGQIVRDQPGVKEQVGVYLDESVISLSLFTPDLDLFDTQRVEVLRGPQGTLFGSGSLSGTVRYITNPPKLGTTERFAELGLNVAGGGGLGGTTKFGANLPLGEKAALRLTTYFGRVPGFMDAVQPDLSVTDDVNDGFRAGLRVAALFAPSAQTTITPRVVYQRVRMDGWNRIDAFNILANPFTTTRPAVTLGERQQFTQLQEDFTDDFMLADVQINHQVRGLTLTSVTSYTFRDVLVVRDAGALTSSITGGTIGLPENVYTLDAPLNDATTANVWTQELRVSSNTDRFPWLAGLFYSHTDRQYGQDLPVLGFESLTGIPTQGLRAPRDTLFFSDLDYSTNQFALFGEATAEITPKFSLTGGLRFYHFSEDKEQVFDGLFANDNTGTSLVSQPGSTDANGVAPRVIAMYKLTNDTNVNAQLSRGFRLGGINDPLNEPLCTPADLVTFGGRETWLDEKVWNYEGGIKSRVPGVSGSVGASFFYMDISDLQATVTAGSCSSRVVFNVPKARSTGFEVEFEAAPTRNFDFAVSANFTDAELRSTLTSTDTSGNVSVVSGIEEGRRLPTVPRFQFVGAATYQWEVRSGSLAYVTGSYQHIGSRFTQVGDEDLGRLDLLSFGASTIGAPLTQAEFIYDPKLPAYDLLNLRAGLRRNTWDVSVFINNVTDERALLSLDQERNTRARIGYLTNQPRTIGVSTRFDF
jgi:iron complex outermembrane recepter protein